MSDSSVLNLLVEVRHLELGERSSNERLIRSAQHIINQASTNIPSSDAWRTPWMKRPPIDPFSSTCYAYHQLAPNKRLLLRTIPLSPPSNIPPLMDWGNNPTELEGLGLSGLEEFRSNIKPSTGGLTLARQPLLKRGRLVGERPQGIKPSLTKKPRFAVPLPSTSKLPNSAVSARVHNAALSVLQSKSSTRGKGSVRLRLGLSKRTNIGSKLEPHRPPDAPCDLSVKVKLTPRQQPEASPQPRSITELSDSSNSADRTLALGLKIPDSAFDASGNGKPHIQLPMKATPAGLSRFSNTSELTFSRIAEPAGKALVSASPSPLTGRITEVSATSGTYDTTSSGSCADISMLSDSVYGSTPVSSRNITLSPSFMPPLAFPVLSNNLLSINDRVQPQKGDSSNSTSDILLSASLSLSLEELGQSKPSAQKDTTAELSSHLDTSYDLKPNQLMASVLYDSSQDSNGSQDDRSIHSPNLPVNIPTTSNNYESLPWDLSQDDQDGAEYHEGRSSRSSVPLMATERTEAHTLDPEDLRSNDHSSNEINASHPQSPQPKTGLISILYGSSQNSPQLQSRKGIPSDEHDQDSINGDVFIPKPSWSPDASPGSCSNYQLSGGRPSSSWESLPRRSRISPDDLVSASRSLSLEDFEVRRPSDHQSQCQSPAWSKSLTLLQPSVTHYSNIPINPTNGSVCNMPSSLGSHMPVNKRSGMSKLASYAIMEDSPMRSHSPILSFTPLFKPNIPDNSLESIESPDTSQRIDAGKSFRPNPVFKFPLPKQTPELEDDISCESQVLRPKFTSVPHGTPRTSQLARPPDEVPRPENNGLRYDCTSGVPNSDEASAHGWQVVDETENTANQMILQSDAPAPAPDHPSSLTPQPRPPSPLVSKIYKGHLHNVISQPHFLPSLPCPPPSLTEGMLSSLISPSYQNWLDKDGTPAQDQAAAATDFSSDTWGRAAWIIPVRGRAPWEGCSGALVSLRPIKERKKKVIIWTPASLRSFWTQMAGFRETKRVGSLSLSFEAIPGKPSDLEAPKHTSELKASRSFEFIKLYHDARVSLKLRTILQVLEFVDEDRYGIDADVPKEGELETVTMRRLLGASTRLALLDSTGHIVLIS
ncbi:unnamed protein product [Rhizoctonia solani]|uniref:Uncharacterized protein n=1 Tax=Rhizoctonia solani TaxID=456999 RepID=A0A8H2XLM1_9AGAM|nr:unnamed protein product [Rhizoctonia solani]